VLLVTGGHAFEQEPFLRVFQSQTNLALTTAAHDGPGATVFERPDLLQFEVVVLYDMPKTITEPQKAGFRSLLASGVGLVVLHHALVSYQHWPDYERIIGGRYPEEDGKSGVVTPQVGYQHDVEIPVRITDRSHPITAGLSDFTIRDEIYWGFRVGADVHPLLATPHSRSGNPLGWVRQEGASRVVYLQLGHGPAAYANPAYRTLVARSIEWTARGAASAGWLALFNGADLDGWVRRGGEAQYEAAQGQIVGRCASNTPNSFLCTTRDYTNFELQVEFQLDPGLNSGVQIRSHWFELATDWEWQGRKVRVPARRVHGLQVEIDPSTRAWTGGVYEEGARGWLHDLKTNELARQSFHKAWNHFRIVCEGEHIRTWINGVPAADLKDSRVQSGFVGLQVHGVGRSTKSMEVRFRHLILKEL
jgi:type 1 glutamine amidotransferase